MCIRDRFIDRATAGHIDDAYYDEHIRPIKMLSDKWWQYSVKRAGGVLPVPMCKYWGELMGLTHGHVRSPLEDLSVEDKQRLKMELAYVQGEAAE